jgi:putative ATP-dependent endonuclease of OLD family
VKLTSARIRNFRSLRDVTIEFAGTTILLGENSTGKSAVLDALKLALNRRWGARGTGFVEYDFFMDDHAKDPKASPGISIELLFKESVPDEWHEDLTSDLNDVVVTDLETGIDSIRLRTECCYDESTQAFEATWSFLALDGSLLSKKSQRATNLSRFFDYVPLFSVSALRDVAHEFSPRSSLWGQILRRVNVPEEEWKEIEEGLGELNNKALGSDERLEGIRSRLGALGSVCAQGAASAVDIRVLPLKVWDLIQRAEVIVKGRTDSPWLPLNRHGQGVQSLSIIYLYQAFVEQGLAQEYAAHSEPVLLLEEPEAHLHPQAARLLGKELDAIPGQKVATTHSPYFVERIPLDQIRIMRVGVTGSRAFALRKQFTCSVPNNPALEAVIKSSAGLLTYDVVAKTLKLNGALSIDTFRRLLLCFTTPEDRKLYHPLIRSLKDESISYVSPGMLASLQDWARRTRGEIFFSRMWLLCEGQSEFVLYNAIMEMLGKSLDKNGVAVIDYQNNGDPLAFSCLARALGFPWILTCDGDDAGNTVLKRLSDDAEFTEDELKASTLQIKVKDLETLLVKEGLRPEMLAVANALEKKVDPAIDDASLIALAQERKVEYAMKLAEMLAKNPIDEARLPQHIRDLKQRLFPETASDGHAT